MKRVLCTMAGLPESSECFVELNTFDLSQATLIQVISLTAKKKQLLNTSSRGPIVLELLESLQSNIEERY